MKRVPTAKQKPFHRRGSVPTTVLDGSESAVTDLTVKSMAPGKTSSELLAEMQVNALQRMRGKQSFSPIKVSCMPTLQSDIESTAPTTQTYCNILQELYNSTSLGIYIGKGKQDCNSPRLPTSYDKGKIARW